MAAATDDLLGIVGQLHEGVVDDALWQRAIDSVCELLDIPVLLAGAIGRGGKHVELEFSHRAAPSAIALLEGPLASPEHNPWLAYGLRAPLRRVATVADIGGQAYLETTRIWSDFYLPFNLGDSLGGLLERQPEFSHFLVAGRRACNPNFDAAERRALNALIPHIARAWRVRRTLRDMAARVDALSSALDRVERAVVIAGEDGEIRFANRAADRILSRGDALGATQGRVRATHSRHREALRTLIKRAARTAGGTEKVAVDAVALPSETGAPLAVVAEPLASPHSALAGQAAEPGAILFIGDSEASRAPPVDRLQMVYGLTPAEARIASVAARGANVTEAANALGISANTAKFHLKAVFGKVGVSSHAQLVRRVLADVGGLAEPEKGLPQPVSGLACLGPDAR